MTTDASPPASVNFLSAGLATFLSRLALYPLDTLRTRRQAPPPAQIATRASPGSIQGLWAGFLPSAAGAVPAQAVYYSAYSALKPMLGVAPAAAAANVVAAFIRVPPELIKQRAQAGAASSARKSPHSAVLSAPKFFYASDRSGQFFT